MGTSGKQPKVVPRARPNHEKTGAGKHLCFANLSTVETSWIAPAAVRMARGESWEYFQPWNWVDIVVLGCSRGGEFGWFEAILPGVLHFGPLWEHAFSYHLIMASEYHLLGVHSDGIWLFGKGLVISKNIWLATVEDGMLNSSHSLLWSP